MIILNFLFKGKEMKKITTVFHFTPGKIYKIDNLKKQDQVKYKVISRCISINDGKHLNVNPYAKFNDIIVIIGGPDEKLSDWSLDNDDLEENVDAYEINEND